jgi:hypothetical protein
LTTSRKILVGGGALVAALLWYRTASADSKAKAAVAPWVGFFWGTPGPSADDGKGGIGVEVACAGGGCEGDPAGAWSPGLDDSSESGEHHCSLFGCL